MLNTLKNLIILNIINNQYNNPQEMQNQNSFEQQLNYYKNQNDPSQRVSYNLPQNSYQSLNQNLREQYIQTPSNINNYNIIRQQTPNQRPFTPQNEMRVNNNNIPPQYPPQSYLRYKDYIKDKESREEKLELQEYLEQRRLEKAMDEEEKRKKNEYKIPIPNTPQNIKSNFHMTQNNFEQNYQENNNPQYYQNNQINIPYQQQNYNNHYDENNNLNYNNYNMNKNNINQNNTYNNFNPKTDQREEDRRECLINKNKNTATYSYLTHNMNQNLPKKTFREMTDEEKIQFAEQ